MSELFLYVIYAIIAQISFQLPYSYASISNSRFFFFYNSL
jgi:hypothetical protein